MREILPNWLLTTLEKGCLCYEQLSFIRTPGEAHAFLAFPFGRRENDLHML